MNNEIVLTDNGKRVLAFMQENPDMVYVGKDMIADTGIKGIYPVLNSLVKKELVEQADPVTRDFTSSDGTTKPKDYKTYRLTALGKSFVIAD